MTDRSPTATQALDSATEPFRRSDLAIVRFAEFQRLWADYQNALRVPFSLDHTEDERIKAEVERCFENLNNLAKEG